MIDPPLETILVSLFASLNLLAVALLIPQWIVIKSTPSLACISTILSHSSVVISFNAL